MESKFEVKTIVPVHNVNIYGAYQKGKTTCIITEDGEYIEKLTREFNYEVRHSEAAGNKNPFRVKTYRIKTEITNMGKKSQMTEKDLETKTTSFTFTGDATDGEIKWWSNHPSALYNGKSHSNSNGSPYYSVTDLTLAKETKQTTRKENLSICQFVELMSKEDLEDAVYLLGGIPKGMDEGDMKDALIEDNTGLIWQPNRSGGKSNKDNFTTTYMSGSNPQKEITLILAKAKANGIIEERGNVDDHKGWYFHDTNLGFSDNAMLKYFEEHPKVYEAVKIEIEKAEGRYKAPEKIKLPESAAAKNANKRPELIKKVQQLIKDGVNITLPIGVEARHLTKEQAETILKDFPEA